MTDYDEFDAILEEPFGEDVDWTTIEGMTATRGPEPRSDGEEYFTDDGGLDEVSLDEISRLEERAITAGLPGSSSGVSHIHHAPAGSRSTSSASHGGPPIPPIPTPQPPPLSWVETNSDTFFFLDPPPPSLPPKITQDVKCDTQLASLKQACGSPLSPTTPRKRRRLSGSASPRDSPTKLGKTHAEAKSEVLETFESALECPICFDTMAASHSLSCGHSACGACVSQWLHLSLGKATCFSCRARHRHRLIPNFAVDAMAAAYFDERQKNAEGSEVCCTAEDKVRWERRRAEGKAAVKEATESSRKRQKAAPDPEVEPVTPPEPVQVVSEVVVVVPQRRNRRGR